jgi:signal transduction histidine kinase/HAMP domain-containing protein
MNIGSKLNLSFLIVTLLPTILLALLTTSIIGNSKKNDAQETINNNLRAAWMQYYARGYQMQYGMLQASVEDHIRGAISRRDGLFLTGQMKAWKVFRPYVDLWVAVDRDANVIASLMGPAEGVELSLGGLVEGSLKKKSPTMSTEVVPYELLAGEGIAERARVGVVTSSGPRAMDGGTDAEAEGAERPRVEGEGVEGEAEESTDGMMLVVVTPVTDRSGTVIGGIVTGDLLNNDPFIPDSLSESIPGSMVAITMGGVQVSTNAIGDDGMRALGHTIDRNILEELSTGTGYRGEAVIAHKPYITAFDPIRDYKGRVIGSLIVGLPAEVLAELKYENIKAIMSVALLGLFLAAGVGSFIAYMITRPIKSLTRKAQAVSTGNLNVHAEPLTGGNDEIADLARTFAMMVDGLRENEKSIKTSQEKLATQKNLVESIINSLPYCLYVLERNMGIVVWNRHSSRECPICNSAAECYNRNFISHLTSEELTEGLKEVIESVFRTGEPRAMSQVLPGVTGGKDIHVTTSIFPILFEKGGPVEYVVWMAEDITKKKEMEASVISSEKLAAIGQLAAGVAHEVNNPLGGILNCLYNIKNTELTESRKAEYLDFMGDGIKRVQNIVRQLLDFSQQHEPEPVLTDINSMIEGITPLFNHMLSGKEIRLVTGLGEGLPLILVDKHQIEQILVNLTINSIQAVDEEGVVEITTGMEDGWYHIKVSDNGCGITPDDLTRVFDPFFTTKGVGKGTGLGLSVSRGIIERHNGRITVESRPGVGTAFNIYLPGP